MSVRLRIQAFGPFRVRRDGADVALPPSRKTRALLAYLAVVGRPQRREHLCELLWDIPDDPKGALRWSLSKLRQVATIDGDCLLDSDRNAVRLGPSERLDLDYNLIRGLTPDAVNEASTEQLEALATALEEPFLADLSLPRCPEYEAWRTAVARETEVLRLKALRTLIERRAGDPERALGHAHRLQALLPDEDLSREIAALADRARVTAATRSDRAAEAPRVERAEPAALRDAEKTSATSFRQTIRFCRARDGIRIAYASSGAGPPVVRAAHWMSHLEYDAESPVWDHWLTALTDGYSLIRYDERLNGLSEAAAADVSFEAFVADLESVVEAAGVERFVLPRIRSRSRRQCRKLPEQRQRHARRGPASTPLIDDVTSRFQRGARFATAKRTPRPAVATIPHARGTSRKCV